MRATFYRIAPKITQSRICWYIAGAIDCLLVAALIYWLLK